MKRYTLVLGLFFSAVMCKAQEVVDSAYLGQLDSIMSVVEAQNRVDDLKMQYMDLALEDEKRFNVEGLSSLCKGLILKKTERGFMERQSLMARHDFDKRDYAIALTPLAANWIMKAAGVKSRSSIQRMLVANAMSLAIAAGATEGVKHLVTERRPDGEDEHSMPSGHCAMAFASATILSREYGHISPWITIGGYTFASATQLLRIRHNSHWVSDTFVGAGIGMVSTNLGYFITDKILGNDYINAPELRKKDLLRAAKLNAQPSGITLANGTEAGSRTIGEDCLTLMAERDGDVRLKTSAGFTVGVDASWFLNRYFAIEAIGRLTEMTAKVYDDTPVGQSVMYTGDNMRMYHADFAAKASVPMSLSTRVSLRALAGMRHVTGVQMDSYSYNSDNSITYEPFAKMNAQTRFEIGGSLTYEMLGFKSHSIGFVFDYFHAFSHLMSNRYGVCTTWKIYL